MDQVVIDSDFLVALGVESDSTHARAKEFALNNFSLDWVVINLVKFEVATVLSRKVNQSDAIDKFNKLNWEQFTYITVDQKLEEQALNIYYKQTKKNISLTDCANLALAQEMNCKIASFDEFYKGLRFFE